MAADASVSAIAVVGCGTMGRGIAQLAAAAGFPVRLCDSRPAAAGEARDAVRSVFAMLASKGRMTGEAAAAAAGRLSVADDLDALAGCDLVIEAIVEDLQAKQDLFRRIEAVVDDESLLASNTSSLSVTAIAAACRNPQRVAGLHFFNPVPLMKVVEVIGGALTGPGVVERLVALVERMGHHAVRAADTPGFIVNHAGRGFAGEALRILQEGVAPFEEVDRILREAAGFRMGPFELLDLTGLDVSHPVMESLYRGFYEEPRFRPSYLLRQRQAAGLLGRKSGRGFYAYDGADRLERPDTAPLPRGAQRPVWVSAAQPHWHSALSALLQRSGWEADGGERPAADSLCLVTPLGDDTTTAALAEGLDPRRVAAVDMLFGLDGRRSLMLSPATAPDFADSAAALLASDGIPVSRLRDSTGFVAQRVVATIVNIACDMAQARIAAPAEIDVAVRLGLAYPQGPLAWGDAIGPGTLLSILEAIFRQTGDPRYRPSPWLSRRARLGLSLLAED